MNILRTRKMKVLAFVEYLPPKLGSDRRIFELMKRMAIKNEVHFAVFPPFRELRDKSYMEKQATQSHSHDGRAVIRYEGIFEHSVRLSPRVSLLWQHSLIAAYFVTAISVFFSSFTILRNIDPDVIVLNYPSPYTGLLGFLEGKLWRKKVVADFNDLIAQYSSVLLNIDPKSLTAKLLVQVQRFVVRNSDRTIAPTRFIKNYAVSLGVPEDKISIIPNGVDTKLFDPNGLDPAKVRSDLHLNKERLCVYSGRLDGWAGMNILCRLCEDARLKKLNVRFLFVGSGDSRNITEDNVLYVGELPYEEIPSILAVADVVLVPFPNNEISSAASPLKLFEGMSMQKPVIASRVAGIQEVILDRENGFLADPDSPEEWIQKLETLLNSEKLRARIGENARRTVEDKFDWGTLAKQYEETLKALLSQAPYIT
jgi:glycosyltransferase involved in cell wall biosynthesis